MSVCRQCGREVITARLGADVVRVFDAEPRAGGEWALWFAPAVPGAPQGVWRARHQRDGDRTTDDRLRGLHDCQPADQQLELA